MESNFKNDFNTTPEKATPHPWEASDHPWYFHYQSTDSPKRNPCQLVKNALLLSEKSQ